MIKATFNIPYGEIQDEVFNSLKEINEAGIVFETTHIIGTQEAFIKECDSDIVISRGVTYLALKKNLKNVSVIEIAVTGYDVIRAIDECKKKYNPKKIAVIGSETMVYGAESLEDIMGVEIMIFKVEDEEDAVNALKKAREGGADAVVGGLMTYGFAQNDRWDCVWIKTGKEAIRQAIKEALNAAGVIRLERAKAELFKIILENTKEAIVAADQEGIITAFNKAAYKTLGISKNKKVDGQPVKEVLPELDFLKVIETGEEEIGVIDNINGRLIVSNRVPIKTSGYKAGAVMTFQNADKIQEIESKIRKELSSKGLVAKYTFENIAGSSNELARTLQMAYKYSQVDSNILLIGETGTGKELFAQSIHNSSSRKFEPFVAVNCAALPENLLESELFGYVEGAFSGASKGGKTGLFELSHKGTIFLDEVGELPINLQAKLLRVLQEREIRKVGDDRVVPIDVRIICATNIDLKERVKESKFRQDLLYRLDVLNLKIPSLYERKDDIEYIAKHFIEKYCKKFDKPLTGLSSDAIDALKAYNWPGNIRELRNICERLVVLTENDYITREDVAGFLGVYEDQNIATSYGQETEQVGVHLENIDMDALLRLMQVVKISKSEMARILGVSRTTLWRKFKDIT